MKRITNIIPRVARQLLTAAVTLALASCATTDDLDPNTGAGAFDPNAYLTLSTATVEGHAALATARAARSTGSSNTLGNSSSSTRAAITTPIDRPIVSTFEEGDVIQMAYDFDGNPTTPEGYGIAYAKLTATGTWTLYADLALNEEVKPRPNPDHPAESWDNLWLGFNFHPRGIITDKEGKLQYGGVADYYDPATKVRMYYDCLYAYTRRTTDGTLAADEYRVGTDGKVTACFRHQFALLSLPESALSVSGYPEAYDGINTLTGRLVYTDPNGTTIEENIAFIHTPGATAGTGTWQAIADATNPADGTTFTLQSLTATLAKGGTADTPAYTVTAPVSSAADGTPVPLRRGTRYPLSLSLTPTRSIAVIKGGTTGWGDEEGMQSDGYILATPGDRSSHWTIRNARGLAAFSDYVNSIDYSTNPDAVCPNATLAADIDLAGSATNQWTPIGKDLEHPYFGTFDGANHTVSGLYIDDAQSGLAGGSSVYQGLFGYLSGATVQHLTVKGSVTLAATDGVGNLWIYAGGIAGSAGNGTTLTDCHSEVSVSATGNSGGLIIVRAGGIVGFGGDSSLRRCTSTGAVTSKVSRESGEEHAHAGGICGGSDVTSLTDCSHTTGAVSATTPKGSTCAGGVVGDAGGNTDTPLLGCTNTAAVSGSAGAGAGSRLRIGGVAGVSRAPIVACSNSGTIAYNAGGGLYAGGVVGQSNNTVHASFSIQVPTKADGGSEGTSPNIGGVIGIISTNVAAGAPYAVSACFYVSASENDGMGINGIGGISGNGGTLETVNTGAGRVATLAALNGKVEAMNTAIGDYNATAPEAAQCPYRWVAATAADTDAPTLAGR